MEFHNITRFTVHGCGSSVGTDTRVVIYILCFSFQTNSHCFHYFPPFPDECTYLSRQKLTWMASTNWKPATERNGTLTCGTTALPLTLLWRISPNGGKQKWDLLFLRFIEATWWVTRAAQKAVAASSVYLMHLFFISFCSTGDQDQQWAYWRGQIAEGTEKD